MLLHQMIAPTNTEYPRVLHIVRSLETGGLERLVCDLVTTRGVAHNPVVCMTVIGALGQSLQEAGASITAIGARGRLATVARLCGLIRHLKPDIIHCHNMLSHFYGHIGAALCGGIPVIVTKHGRFVPKKGITTSLNRKLLRRATVTCVSRDIEAIMLQWLPHCAARIHFVPNGIDVSRYSRAVISDGQQSRPTRTGTFTFCTVSRLVKGKDHSTLLQAFASALQHRPDLRLLIVGDGPERMHIEQMIACLGLLNEVTLLGERHDIPAILSSCHAFVLASQNEGTPITILEAMASGLPVIATAVGGIPQLINNGETGVLVPPGQPHTMADALGAIAGSDELCRKISIAARKHVEASFDMRRVVVKYDSLYSNALAARKS